uniref:Uncharacterized protein n=1 Tax=Sphaerodactylus townsendi TaxID=933632 RepID=A0ACB8EVK5_9SAUR
MTGFVVSAIEPFPKEKKDISWRKSCRPTSHDAGLLRTQSGLFPATVNESGNEHDKKGTQQIICRRWILQPASNRQQCFLPAPPCPAPV